MTQNSNNVNKLVYRAHDTAGSKVRVWRTIWGGDTFEILTKEEFRELKASVAKLKPFIGELEIVQAEDDDIDIED